MQNLDVSTVVFAVVAIFVIYRLYSVLGTRTGAERPPTHYAPPPPQPGAADNVVAFNGVRPAPPPSPDRWRGFADSGSPIAAGLDAIAAGEPGFDPGPFVAGARSAYEMIVLAFAAGDLVTLRRLLAPEVLANFTRAIEARRAAEQTMKTTLVSIDAADIVDARVTGGAASLAVKFAAKLISVTLDGQGQTVEGSASAVGDHLDIWTFSRTLGARDPNWLLTATETVH